YPLSLHDALPIWSSAFDNGSIRPKAETGASPGTTRQTTTGRRLSQRLFVGINDAAGLLVGRRENCLIAHAAPGLEVRGIGDVVVLDLHHPGFGPFAVFAEPDVGGHDGRECVGAHVIGELVVIEALGALDCLLEHLKIGIAPPPEVITEWVDTLAWRKRLVFLEEIRGRRHQ